MSYLIFVDFWLLFLDVLPLTRLADVSREASELRLVLNVTYKDKLNAVEMPE